MCQPECIGSQPERIVPSCPKGTDLEDLCVRMQFLQIGKEQHATTRDADFYLAKVASHVLLTRPEEACLHRLFDRMDQLFQVQGRIAHKLYRDGRKCSRNASKRSWAHLLSDDIFCGVAAVRGAPLNDVEGYAACFTAILTARYEEWITSGNFASADAWFMVEGVRLIHQMLLLSNELGDEKLKEQRAKDLGDAVEEARGEVVEDILKDIIEPGISKGDSEDSITFVKMLDAARYLQHLMSSPVDGFVLSPESQSVMEIDDEEYRTSVTGLAPHPASESAYEASFDPMDIDDECGYFDQQHACVERDVFGQPVDRDEEDRTRWLNICKACMRVRQQSAWEDRVSEEGMIGLDKGGMNWVDPFELLRPLCDRGSYEVPSLKCKSESPLVRSSKPSSLSKKRRFQNLKTTLARAISRMPISCRIM